MSTDRKTKKVSELQALLEKRQASRGQLFQSHHMEFVLQVDGVSYINDAASITFQQTRLALEQIKEEIIWMALPSAQNDYNKLISHTKNNLKGVISVEDNLNCYAPGLAKKVKAYINATDMKEAIVFASKIAKSGQVVLFSPSSNPIFNKKSIKERGDEFKRLVKKLSENKLG